MHLSIGKLANAGGVGVETVRYYQRKGLLDKPGGEGVRRYDQAHLRRLRFIRSAQRAGFTLEEIRELLALDAGYDHARARELALTRLVKLDRQIAELEHARNGLRRLAERCAANADGPCPILAAFEP